MTTTTETKLETKTCPRCGGSGHYSFCPRYGTKCFQCGGVGRVYTKRGRAARAYLETIRSKALGELVAGDVVLYEGIPGVTGDRWVTIASGVPVDATGLVDVEGTDKRGMTCGWRGSRTDTLVRVAQSAEQKAETYARAVAYQATLTKAGTVRKNARKAA